MLNHDKGVTTWFSQSGPCYLAAFPGSSIVNQKIKANQPVKNYATRKNRSQLITRTNCLNQPERPSRAFQVHPNLEAHAAAYVLHAE